jgi:hypothetical protein
MLNVACKFDLLIVNGLRMAAEKTLIITVRKLKKD